MQSNSLLFKRRSSGQTSGSGILLNPHLQIQNNQQLFIQSRKGVTQSRGGINISSPGKGEDEGLFIDSARSTVSKGKEVIQGLVQAQKQRGQNHLLKVLGNGGNEPIQLNTDRMMIITPPDTSSTFFTNRLESQDRFKTRKMSQDITTKTTTESRSLIPSIKVSVFDDKRMSRPEDAATCISSIDESLQQSYQQEESRVLLPASFANRITVEQNSQQPQLTSFSTVRKNILDPTKIKLPPGFNYSFRNPTKARQIMASTIVKQLSPDILNQTTAVGGGSIGDINKNITIAELQNSSFTTSGDQTLNFEPNHGISQWDYSKQQASLNQQSISQTPINMNTISKDVRQSPYQESQSILVNDPATALFSSSIDQPQLLANKMAKQSKIVYNGQQVITPELAAQVVKNYLLPMFKQKNSGAGGKRKGNRKQQSQISTFSQDSSQLNTTLQMPSSSVVFSTFQKKRNSCQENSRQTRQLSVLKELPITGQEGEKPQAKDDKGFVLSELEFNQELYIKLKTIEQTLLEMQEKHEGTILANRLLKKQNDELKHKYSILKQQNRIAKQQNTELKHEIQRLTYINLSQQSSLNELFQLYTASESDRKRLSEICGKQKEARAMIEHFENNMAAKCKLQEIERDIVIEGYSTVHENLSGIFDLKAKEDQFFFQMKTLKQNNEAIQEEKQELFKRITVLNEQSLALQKDLKNSSDNTQKMIKKREIKIKYLQETNATLIQERDESRTNATKLEVTLKQNEVDLNKAYDEISVLRSKLDTLYQKWQSGKFNNKIRRPICKRCNQEYNENENFNWSCRTHQSEYGGTMWWCCGRKEEEAQGCKLGKHVSKIEEPDKNDIFNRKKTKKIAEILDGEDEEGIAYHIKCYCCRRYGHSGENCEMDPNIKTIIGGQIVRSKSIDDKEVGPLVTTVEQKGNELVLHSRRLKSTDQKLSSIQRIIVQQVHLQHQKDEAEAEAKEKAQEIALNLIKKNEEVQKRSTLELANDLFNTNPALASMLGPQTTQQDECFNSQQIPKEPVPPRELTFQEKLKLQRNFLLNFDDYSKATFKEVVKRAISERSSKFALSDINFNIPLSPEEKLKSSTFLKLALHDDTHALKINDTDDQGNDVLDAHKYLTEQAPNLRRQSVKKQNSLTLSLQQLSSTNVRKIDDTVASLIELEEYVEQNHPNQLGSSNQGFLDIQDIISKSPRLINQNLIRIVDYLPKKNTVGIIEGRTSLNSIDQHLSHIGGSHHLNRPSVATKRRSRHHFAADHDISTQSPAYKMVHGLSSQALLEPFRTTSGNLAFHTDNIEQDFENTQRKEQSSPIKQETNSTKQLVTPATQQQ